nr:hypothetical protein [Riboviria sp.]
MRYEDLRPQELLGSWQTDATQIAREADRNAVALRHKNKILMAGGDKTHDLLLSLRWMISADVCKRFAQSMKARFLAFTTMIPVSHQELKWEIVTDGIRDNLLRPELHKQLGIESLQTGHVVIGRVAGPSDGRKRPLGKRSPVKGYNRLATINNEADLLHVPEVNLWFMEETNKVVTSYEVRRLAITASFNSEAVKEAQGHERERSPHRTASERSEPLIDHMGSEDLLNVPINHLRYIKLRENAEPQRSGVLERNIIRRARQIAGDPEASFRCSPIEDFLKDLFTRVSIEIEPLFIFYEWPKLLSKNIPDSQYRGRIQVQNSNFVPDFRYRQQLRMDLGVLVHLLGLNIKEDLFEDLPKWVEHLKFLLGILQHLSESPAFEDGSKGGGRSCWGNEGDIFLQLPSPLSRKAFAKLEYFVDHTIGNWYGGPCADPANVLPLRLFDDLWRRGGQKSAQSSNLRTGGGMTDVAREPFLEIAGDPINELGIRAFTIYRPFSIVEGQVFQGLHTIVDVCPPNPSGKLPCRNNIRVSAGIGGYQCHPDSLPDSAFSTTMFQFSRGRSLNVNPRTN